MRTVFHDSIISSDTTYIPDDLQLKCEKDMQAIEQLLAQITDPSNVSDAMLKALCMDINLLAYHCSLLEQSGLDRDQAMGKYALAIVNTPVTSPTTITLALAAAVFQETGSLDDMKTIFAGSFASFKSGVEVFLQNPNYPWPPNIR